MIVLAILFLLTCFPAQAGMTEIASGSMLGPRYKPDRFYLRTSPYREWKLTYSDGPFRGKARGKLMVLRTAQGLFDDERMRPAGFDPDRNTDRLIQALDVYKEHGVLAVSVSLQGAEPGYPKRDWDAAATEGGAPEKGEGPLVSAFRPDGSLKPAWIDRIERLLTAADQRHMVVCLIYFDPSQDQVLKSPQAILAAARNITDWLIQKDYRNVVIDVANEWDLEGDTWDHFRFVPENISKLVEEVRERFNGADFTLPLGASTSGTMAYPASLARLCDTVLIHGNGRSPREKVARIQPLRATNRPVWMVQDDNGRKTKTEVLSREEASLNAVFANTAGWGYTPWVQAEQYPFEYLPGPTSEFTDQSPEAERQGAYFRAVLERMARFVLKKPPSTATNKQK